MSLEDHLMPMPVALWSMAVEGDSRVPGRRPRQLMGQYRMQQTDRLPAGQVIGIGLHVLADALHAGWRTGGDPPARTHAARRNTRFVRTRGTCRGGGDGPLERQGDRMRVPFACPGHDPDPDGGTA